MNEGTKYDEGKIQYELLPPDFLEAVAQILTYGAKKYAPWNWAKGFVWSRVYGALQRHLNAWWSGEDKDPESGFSHLWHAGCCIAFLITFERRGVGTDDRYSFRKAIEKAQEYVGSKPPELVPRQHCTNCGGCGWVRVWGENDKSTDRIDCGECT